jgi:hypothetical protein
VVLDDNIITPKTAISALRCCITVTIARHNAEFDRTTLHFWPVSENYFIAIIVLKPAELSQFLIIAALRLAHFGALRRN